MNENLRIYTSSDIKGVELGGALKNIIAFCTGMAAGIGLGDNTFAALITRGLVEIRDLIVTCLSEHSRNRKAGYLIGQGKTLEETKKEVGMTIESIDNIEAAKKLSEKVGITLPILDAAYDVLYNDLNPRQAVEMLMTRTRKAED